MTVHHYIHSLPESQREIATVLRSWILDLGPHTVEKISYTVPYFSFYGNLCYLTPQEDGISLSFCRGHELSSEQKLLEGKGRKHVTSTTFYSLAQLEEYEDPIRRILNEAAILNEYRYKRKLKNRK